MIKKPCQGFLTPPLKTNILVKQPDPPVPLGKQTPLRIHPLHPPKTTPYKTWWVCSFCFVVLIFFFSTKLGERPRHAAGRSPRPARAAPSPTTAAGALRGPRVSRGPRSPTGGHEGSPPEGEGRKKDTLQAEGRLRDRRLLHGR